MHPLFILKDITKCIPSCQSCIYNIKNKNQLFSRCKVFEQNDKKAFAIYCRIDPILCGIYGAFYKTRIET